MKDLSVRREECADLGAEVAMPGEVVHVELNFWLEFYVLVLFGIQLQFSRLFFGCSFRICLLSTCLAIHEGLLL